MKIMAQISFKGAVMVKAIGGTGQDNRNVQLCEPQQQLQACQDLVWNGTRGFIRYGHCCNHSVSSSFAVSVQTGNMGARVSPDTQAYTPGARRKSGCTNLYMQRPPRSNHSYHVYESCHGLANSRGMVKSAEICKVCAKSFAGEWRTLPVVSSRRRDIDKSP